MRRRTFTAAIVIGALFATPLLGGCVFSNTITEVNYVQDEAYPVDPDAPKYYVNSPDAKVTSSQIPLIYPVAEGAWEYIDSLPAYEGDLSDVEIHEPKEGHMITGDASMNRVGEDLEATEGGSEHDDEAENTPESTAGNSSGSGSPVNSSSAQRVGRSSNSDSGEATSGASTDEAAGGTEGQTNAGGGRDDGGENAGNNEGGRPSSVGITPGSAFGDLGANDELPEGMHNIAALGSVAVAVASLGGADGDPNLMGTSDDLMNKGAAALAARGIGNASSITTNGGLDLDKLINLAVREKRVDAYVVESGALSAEDEATIVEYGMNVVYMPPMNTPENITACVTRVGELLAKAGDGQATSIASDYVAFHDDVYNSYGNDQLRLTLYVDNWYSDVSYSNPHGFNINLTGVAFAPSGAAAQPISQYINAGGVLNVPYVKPHYTSMAGDAIVWPFKNGTNDGDWNGVSSVNNGQSTSSTGFDYALTRYLVNNNMSDFRDLGSSEYPSMIVSNSGVQGAIANDRANGGVYAAGSSDLTSIASNDYGIIVNPHGIFSSWASGSMESVLETPWIAQMYYGDGSLESRVRDFYKRFYGYDLGDEYSSIISGAYAG